MYVGDEIYVPVISSITRSSPTAARINIVLDPELSADALVKVTYYNTMRTSPAQVHKRQDHQSF